MNLIKSIKLRIEEYKKYKNPRSNALTVQNSKSRNLFKYIQAISLGRKYGETLYKHFKVMNDIDSYDFLINLFGKKNIENALNNKEVSTADIVDQLFKGKNIEISAEMQSNYILRNMINARTFSRATGLNLSEFQLGINPVTFSRKSLNNRTMLNIFEENQVTKDILEEIYYMYEDEIVSSYNNDSHLRNKTVLKLDDKHENTIAVNGLQDHVTHYSEDDFKAIFHKYFSNEELTDTERYILMGLLAKEADLIGTYSIKHLREHPEYIKSEINVGIFNDIIFSRKKYTNEERKQIVTFCKGWTEDDLNRYNNLGLLKQRLESLPKTQDIFDKINSIGEILSKPLSEVVRENSEILDFIQSVFMDYEIENRSQIVEKVYDPEKKQEIVITDLAQISSATMLHFFNPNRTMSNFDEYIKNLEEKRSKELGKKFEFSEDEKKVMLLQYQAKENHYITDYALDFEGIGQVGSFDARYLTNTSEQLCTMIITPQEILKDNGTRGQIALGFSKETLSPELIATISDKNIHSNKGIDYVESDNPFEDFSVSYDELISGKKRFGDNNEIVLFRNSYEASLKPSYVMYIGNNKIDSQMEKQNIEKVKKQMEEAGLYVPLVIFDRYSIRENLKNNQLSQNKNYGVEGR